MTAIDASFAHVIITWQQQHGRHHLPWQNTRDPYRIWLAEVMLQQTQVGTVIPYYQRFLDHFPDILSLAAAPLAAVLAHWSGLGYYSRARNLHRCAQTIVTHYSGQFPDDPHLLAQLPGIGRSTAAAIAAFAYGKRAAILDGNVKRVLTRVFGIEGYPGTKLVMDELWRHATALLPQHNVESYTQGLMDLGSTLCVRKQPLCHRCPLVQRCVAYTTGRVAELPTRQLKKIMPEKEIVMLVASYKNTVLLQQRPDYGIWGGLLSLPEFAAIHPHSDQVDRAIELMLEPFGQIASYAVLPTFSPIFTHFRLRVLPYHIVLEQQQSQVAERGYIWYEISQLVHAPLPAPVKKLLLGMFNLDEDFERVVTRMNK